MIGTDVLFRPAVDLLLSYGHSPSYSFIHSSIYRLSRTYNGNIRKAMGTGRGICRLGSDNVFYPWANV